MTAPCLLWLRAIGLLFLYLTAVCGQSPLLETAWTVEIPGGTVGHPAPLGRFEAAEGILVTTGAGKILILDARGRVEREMALDLPPAGAAIAGSVGIVAVDAWGSVYCFDRLGARKWKYARQSSMSGGYRLPVLADLDGDGKQEVFVSDSRGLLLVLDAEGRPRLEVQSTNYRLCPPAVGDLNGDGTPEIVFGTEDHEVHALTGRGELLWSARLDARFGRTLPVVADTDGDGAYEVYVASSFVHARPGLFSLDGRTGALRWKAPSQLQSYQSTAIADLDGDGAREILYGDKNTRLYCANARGEPRWAVQLGGRGIFFAPAVADLQGDGKGTVFAVVRGSGPEGHGLYALDPAGRVVAGVALDGGGTASPLLCRFRGVPELHLLAYGGTKKLHTFRPKQNPRHARILWASLRNDEAHAGWSAASRRQPAAWAMPPAAQTQGRRDALNGTNTVTAPSPATGALAAIRVAAPGGHVRTTLVRPQEGEPVASATFAALAEGDYPVEITWRAGPDSRLLRHEQRVYRLATGAAAEEADLTRLQAKLDALKSGQPPRADLADYAAGQARAALDLARKRNRVDLFDQARAQRAYLAALAAMLERERPESSLRVRRLANPWPNLDPPSALAGGEPAVSLTLLGNEAESAALAVTNLATYSTTVRLAVPPFVAEDKKTTPAPGVLEFREVPLIRPESTGRPAEDVLPRLAEGQTLRLGPLETRKVWLVAHSRRLATGVHRATLEAGDLLSVDEPRRFPVEIKVLPLRLPDRLTYRHGNWLYLASIADERLREATIADALAHGTNVFNVPACTVKVDAAGRIAGAITEPHDTLVKRLRGRAFFMIGGSVGIQWPAGSKPGKELEDRVFAEAVRWYARHMEALGVPYEDFGLYTQDEPGLMGHDANYEQYMANVRRIKAAEPRIQIYANPAGGARAEVLAPIADLISVWQPDLHLVRDQPQELGALFRRGKQYWHYEAPADQRNLDTLGYYRMKPWVAYQMGMTGGGFWVYSYSPYWFFNRTMATEYGTVYPAEAGPVTTKRWEASRDGAEDFEVLWRLRQLTRDARSPRAQEARRLLDEAVSYVTKDQEKASDIGRQLHPFAPDFEAWMSYRDRLVKAWMDLEAEGAQ